MIFCFLAFLILSVFEIDINQLVYGNCHQISCPCFVFVYSNPDGSIQSTAENGFNCINIYNTIHSPKHQDAKQQQTTLRVNYLTIILLAMLIKKIWNRYSGLTILFILQCLVAVSLSYSLSSHLVAYCFDSTLVFALVSSCISAFLILRN